MFFVLPGCQCTDPNSIASMLETAFQRMVVPIFEVSSRRESKINRSIAAESRVKGHYIEFLVCRSLAVRSEFPMPPLTCK